MVMNCLMAKAVPKEIHHLFLTVQQPHPGRKSHLRQILRRPFLSQYCPPDVVAFNLHHPHQAGLPVSSGHDRGFNPTYQEDTRSVTDALRAILLAPESQQTHTGRSAEWPVFSPAIYSMSRIVLKCCLSCKMFAPAFRLCTQLPRRE